MHALETPSAGTSRIVVATHAAVGYEIGAKTADWVRSTLGHWTGGAVGVGVDLVDIRKLADMIEASGPSFVDLCWTPAEQAYCALSVPRLAARWAAKEATMKALGHGIGEVDPIDIEVVSAEGETPSLQLHGSLAALARDLRVDHLAVSITHDANIAIAFVVAVREGFDTEAGNVTETGAGAHKGGKGSRDSLESRDQDGVSIEKEKGGH